MTEEIGQEEVVYVDEDKAIEYVQEALKKEDIEMDKEKIALVIEHYYGFLGELGLLQEPPEDVELTEQE